MFGPIDIERWMKGRKSGLAEVKGQVEAIIAEVKNGGDAALIELSARHGRAPIESIAVCDEEIDDAYDRIDSALLEAIVEAEARIAEFHALQRPRDLWLKQVEPGVILGVKTTPLERVGAYVPGGRAAYPSTALMCVVPARIAGVSEVCCCSPHPIHPATLVALDVAGADEIYRVGGAQAIAAMALGTESIRPVQKIVGPGNVYVTAAKMLLRDHAEIDFPAGPSEIGIVADDTANAEFIAIDILAQAEHDPQAACILITPSGELAAKVGAHIERLLEASGRRDIMRQALSNSGYLLVRDLSEAADASDQVAPEHLSIQVADPLSVLNRVRNAGAIFVGPYAAVACGDYAAGPNHVLPTAGYARTYSGLDVMHFCKTSSVQIVDRLGIESLGDVVERIADAEGLFAHADSVRIRRRPKQNP
ncbi:MAG: histidinol dehydrogenase [Methanomicrobiales archaeon]|nr:histidinol dehydrogenase [Methanomicrobiales archaeon]